MLTFAERSSSVRSIALRHTTHNAYILYMQERKNSAPAIQPHAKKTSMRQLPHKFIVLMFPERSTSVRSIALQHTILHTNRSPTTTPYKVPPTAAAIHTSQVVTWKGTCNYTQQQSPQLPLTSIDPTYKVWRVHEMRVHTCIHMRNKVLPIAVELCTSDLQPGQSSVSEHWRLCFILFLFRGGPITAD